MLHIVPIYAVLLTFLFIFLSIRTIRLRRKHHIGIGDSGNQDLLRAMRVHSNFSEYTPLALILFSMIEINGGNPIFLHIFGSCFLMGRILHAFGVSQSPENLKFRQFGMILTFSTLITSSICLLYGLVE